MLEESSFPNRRADYFWLLLLSSIMLLVLSLSRISLTSM
jgi:Derlin-2/3